MERRNRVMRAVSATADRIIAPIRRKRGLSEAALVSDWENILGRDLAAECIPLRLVPGGEGVGGTLHIRVSGALALELQHLQPQVIERINSYFGYRAVGRIALHQGPIGPRSQRPRRTDPPPTPGDLAALENRLGSVEDPELRRALADMGHGVLSRKQRQSRKKPG